MGKWKKNKKNKKNKEKGEGKGGGGICWWGLELTVGGIVTTPCQYLAHERWGVTACVDICEHDAS